MTALSANIDATQTLIPVDAALVNGTFQYPLYYTVDSESIRVVGRVIETTWLVDRGIAGTTAASHLSAATLTRYYPDGATAPGDGGAIAVLEDPGNVWEAETAVALGYRIAYTDPTHGARVHVFEVTTPGTTDATADFTDMLSDNREELQPGGVVPGSEVEWTYVGIVGAIPSASPAFAVLPRGATWTLEDGLTVVASVPAAENEPVLVISDSTGLEIFRLYSSGDGDWTARAGGVITLKAIGDGAGNDAAVIVEDDDGFGGAINLSAGGTAMVAIERSGGVSGLAFFGGVAPTTQPTGVAVTAEAIHAALVSLGLITGP